MYKQHTFEWRRVFKTVGEPIVCTKTLPNKRFSLVIGFRSASCEVIALSRRHPLVSASCSWTRVFGRPQLQR